MHRCRRLGYSSVANPKRKSGAHECGLRLWMNKERALSRFGSTHRVPVLGRGRPLRLVGASMTPMGFRLCVNQILRGITDSIRRMVPSAEEHEVCGRKSKNGG